MEIGELATLRESWVTHLTGEHKSPHTIRTYLAGVAAFTRWYAGYGCQPCTDSDPS